MIVIYDMIWYDMTWCDMTWCDMTWYQSWHLYCDDWSILTLNFTFFLVLFFMFFLTFLITVFLSFLLVIIDYHLSIYLSIYLSLYLSIFLSYFLSFFPFLSQSLPSHFPQAICRANESEGIRIPSKLITCLSGESDPGSSSSATDAILIPKRNSNSMATYQVCSSKVAKFILFN